MSLPIALLLHFNQHFSEYAGTASRACYRGLLRVLRAHPALKFNIHISGTLIHALKWIDPEPLELIRDGLSVGQFELLGSTYAQNVMYASDDWDNAQQIDLHKQVLRDTFGLEPSSFWIPERCWRQSLLPLIAEAGYRTTLLEDHILRKAGADKPLTFTTTLEGRWLKIVADDETLRHKFNFAAWFGRQGQALEYLRRLAADEASAKFCAAYAEDAEAMGLWGWECGVLPNQTWAHLDELLTALESLREVKLVQLSESPPPSGDLSPIPDGSAAWMDASLRRPGAPYHEDGYADWFDFNRRSPKLTHFRQTYSIIRAKVQAVDSDKAAVQRLKQAALHAYCAHQYEFGCIGIGGLNYRGWENARTAVALARAAQQAQSPSELVLIDDCNGDGSDEVMIGNGRELMITSAYGGRLLYWFDLTTGQQFVGNQLPVIPGEYLGGRYDEAPPEPARWLPDSYEPMRPSDRVDEMPPTRLGRFLPPWVWEGEPTPLALAVRDTALGESRPPLQAQARVFLDSIILDGGAAAVETDHWLDSRLEKGGITFINYLTDELTMEKTLRFVYGRVSAAYMIRNHDNRPRSMRLHIRHELCPDYDEVVKGGRDSLKFIDGGKPGVLNTRTGTAIVIQSSREWQAVEQRVDFCALTVGLTYDMALAPRSEQRFEIRLGRTEKK